MQQYQALDLGYFAAVPLSNTRFGRLERPNEQLSVEMLAFFGDFAPIPA